MKIEHVVLAFAGATVLWGCLPGDIRPEPGRVYVTAEPSNGSLEGFMTDDGWSLRFERLLVSLGDVALRGDDCVDYANTRYERLFDFTVPGATKVGEVYGLGTCDLRVRLDTPGTDALLEKGTTSADLAFMREPVVDLPDDLPISIFGDLAVGTSVYVRGLAEREGVTKRVEWKLSGRISVSDCKSSPDAVATSELKLAAGDDLRPKVSFHVEELFRQDAQAGAALRFAALAEADADGDGSVTLKELEELPSPPVEMMPNEPPNDGPMIPTAPPLKGLAGYIQSELMPRTLYLDGVRCKERQQQRGN